MADASKVGAGVATGLGAAGSIFATAAAANAIPVAGQFVSAGLAIAGMFIKIFAGRRQKKRAEEAARRAAEAAKRKAKAQKDHDRARAAKGTGVQGSGEVGAQQAQQSLQTTAPVTAPQQTSFTSWGGGSAPSVQPTQQVLNNQLGMK